MAKILLVEDAPSVADMLLVWLKMNGHYTEVAFTQNEANTKLSSLKPDLILIDVLLSQGNGKELCKDIRTIDKKVPIVLMSANSEFLKDYTAYEANDVLEKPFEINNVIKKINKLLE